MFCGLACLAGPGRAQERSAGDRELRYHLEGGQTYPGGGRGFAEFVAPAAQAGKFVSRRLEILLDAEPLLLRQPDAQELGRETAFAVSVGAGLRWYPAPLSWKAAPFFEVVEGVFYADHRVPAPGTRFNFLTRIGFGLQLPLGRRIRPFATCRWVHISNAYLSRPNPGWGFIGVSTGVSLEFPKEPGP